MKLSQLVEDLIKQMNRYGDGEVYSLDECGSRMDVVVYYDWDENNKPEYRVDQTFNYIS